MREAATRRAVFFADEEKAPSISSCTHAPCASQPPFPRSPAYGAGVYAPLLTRTAVAMAECRWRARRGRARSKKRGVQGADHTGASVLSLCLTSLLPPGRESSNSTVHTLPRHRPVLDSVHHSPTLMTFASARLPGGGPTPTTPRRLARRRAAALPPPRTTAAAAPPPPRAATAAAADEPVEAILFDMDGVLTLSEELSRECVFFERVRGCSNKKNSPSQPRASHVLPSLTPLHPLPTHHSISIPPPESAPAS